MHDGKDMKEGCCGQGCCSEEERSSHKECGKDAGCGAECGNGCTGNDVCIGGWTQPHCTDVGLLLMRIALAIVFFYHGATKFMALKPMQGFFASLGMPGWIAGLVAVLEICAAVAMLLGVWVRAAGFVLAAIMVGAIVLVKFSVGFNGGYEFELSLLLIALGLTFTKAGSFTAKKFFHKQ